MSAEIIQDLMADKGFGGLGQQVLGRRGMKQFDSKLEGDFLIGEQQEVWMNHLETSNPGEYSKSLKADLPKGNDFGLGKERMDQDSHVDLLETHNEKEIWKEKKQRTQILPADQKIKGLTQQELADLWWSIVFSTPLGDVPFFSTGDLQDPRGRRGTLESHEKFQARSPQGVYFLGGLFGSESVERTIVAQPNSVYFAPFINTAFDNTTDDTSTSPSNEFPGGYALTPKHAEDLKTSGITPRKFVTPEEVYNSGLEYLSSTFLPEDQFLFVNGKDFTPANIEDYRQETDDVGYDLLPRHTGELSGSKFLADPDLILNPEASDTNTDPYKFPELLSLNPNYENLVVPFVQTGYYFGLKLASSSQIVQFGGGLPAKGFEQNITYNLLNPIEGNNKSNHLRGTSKGDYLDGKNGNDKLFGKDGDDLLVGGNGRDCLNGGRGDDELWGDKGLDKFIFNRGFGKDTIFDLETNELIYINGFNESPEVAELPLESGVLATQIKFNEQDVLTLVGVEPEAISINLDKNIIKAIGNI